MLLFLAPCHCNTHECAIGKNRIRETLYKRITCCNGIFQVVAHKEKIPTRFIRLFDNCAVERIAVREIKDRGNALKAVVRFLAGAVYKTNILEDCGPLVEELRFEEKLLCLNRSLA